LGDWTTPEVVEVTSPHIVPQSLGVRQWICRDGQIRDSIETRNFNSLSRFNLKFVTAIESCSLPAGSETEQLKRIGKGVVVALVVVVV
jgi:hypothetical protein